jgi:predicted N-acetyltransferase YhbS
MDLVARTATGDDVDAIIELNRNGNGADVATELRAGFDGGAFTVTDFVVVRDGLEVVSTLGLLSLQLSLGDVVMPTGQPEFVATHPDYRGRGLVRTLLDLVHERSAERGDLLQLIAGIPYFYRQFGYEYCIPFPRERLLPPESDLGTTGDWATRAATPEDIPAMLALQDAAQSPADLRLPFPEEVWPVLTELPHVELAVAHTPDGHVAGVARIRPIPNGQVRVTSVAARNVGAARALLVRGRRASPGCSLVVADRLDSPVSALLAAGSLPTRRREWLYGRTPDPAALLAHLRPVLGARLAASSLANEAGRAGISLYRSTLNVTYQHGAVTDLSTTPGVPPDDDKQTQLPPELIGRVLFGPEGVLAFEEHPDVNLGADRELLGVLFPPVRSDVLMW